MNWKRTCIQSAVRETLTLELESEENHASLTTPAEMVVVAL
jgi:hypothetical protein